MNTCLDADRELSVVMSDECPREPSVLHVSDPGMNQRIGNIKSVRIAGDRKSVLRSNAIIRIRSPRTVVIEDPLPRHDEKGIVERHLVIDAPLMEEFIVGLAEVLDFLRPPRYEIPRFPVAVVLPSEILVAQIFFWDPRVFHPRPPRPSVGVAVPPPAPGQSPWGGGTTNFWLRRASPPGCSPPGPGPFKPT